MRPYEFVDHTADYALVARGADEQELVQNAARGMVALMVDARGLSGSAREIKASGETLEQLVVRALKQLLVLVQDGELPLNVTAARVDGTEAALEVEVVPLGGHEERLQADIKAVTYHDLEVVRDTGGLTVRVVFDT